MEEFEAALRAVLQQAIQGFAARQEPLYPQFQDLLEKGSRIDLIVACPTFPDLVNAVISSDFLTDRFLSDLPAAQRSSNLVALRIAWLCVMPLLDEYLVRVPAFRFENSVFQSIYDDAQARLIAGDLSLIQVSPLYGCEVLRDPIAITDQLTLRAVSPEEIERWSNTDPSRLYDPLLLLGPQVRSAIELRYPDQHLTDEQVGELIELPTKLMNILRLLSDGGVTILFHQLERRMPVGQHREFRAGANLVDGTGIRLTKEGGEIVKSLWKSLNNPSMQSLVGLAFRRWSSGIERKTDEDRIIDYWVGLESLFATGSNQEILFRCSYRMAAYLGKNGGERKEIVQDVQDCYSWRSALAHGSKQPEKKVSNRMSIDQAVAKSRSYLRDALLKILRFDHAFDARKIECEFLGREFTTDV